MIASDLLTRRETAEAGPRNGAPPYDDATAAGPHVPQNQAMSPPAETVLAGHADARPAYIAIAAVGMVAFLVLAAFDAGPMVLRDGIYTVLELLALAACLIRAVLVPARRLAWSALAAGIAAWTVGDLLFAVVYEPSGSIPYPSVGDGLYLSFYLACFVALALFARERLVGAGLSLDALIGVLTVAAVWGAVLPSGVFDISGSTAAVATNLLYPLCDLLLLALVAVMLTKTRWQLGTAASLLALALVLMAIADTIYLIEVAQDSYRSGTMTDILWPASLVVLGLAAWTPVPPAGPRLRAPTAEYVFPVACALVALGFLVWDHFNRADDLTVVFAAAVIAASTLRGARLYQLREHAARSAEESIRQTVTALALTVDAKDAYTANHSQRVTLYALAIGVDMGLPSGILERLCTAGELHDLGKLAIPDSVLLKPGRLTDEEYDVIKQHSEAGEHIVTTAGMQDIGRIVRHHHERWDGRGYPDAIAGTKIPLESRILAVADSLDAMTSARSYRPSLSTPEARRELERNIATQFDAAMAASAVSLLDRRVIRPGEEPPVAIDELIAGRADEPWVEQVESMRGSLAPVQP